MGPAVYPLYTSLRVSLTSLHVELKGTRPWSPLKGIPGHRTLSPCARIPSNEKRRACSDCSARGRTLKLKELHQYTAIAIGALRRFI